MTEPKQSECAECAERRERFSKYFGWSDIGGAIAISALFPPPSEPDADELA